MDKEFIEKIKKYAVGKRSIHDPIFVKLRLPRLGVYDADEDDSDTKVNQTPCNVPGCQYIGKTLLEYENHYNSMHRYSCSQCKKILPSPHFLDLHIQENHDSYFAVMAQKKPSYSCYIEDCKLKFVNATERFEHGVKEHRLPKNFRFDQRKKKDKNKDNVMNVEEDTKRKDNAMNVDEESRKFYLNNSKQKTFSKKYVGKKFTKDKKAKSETMDICMDELKDSLPK